MAAKLTFEAKMQGMEQVLDMLKTAESRFQDLGRIGSYSLEGVDKRMKEFSMSLETITKSQSGFKALFDSFDKLGKYNNEFLGKAYKGVLDGMKHEVKGFEGEIDKINRKIEDSQTRLEHYKAKKGQFKNEDIYESGLRELQREADGNVADKLVAEQQKNQMQLQLRMASPAFGLSPDGMGRFVTQGNAFAYGPGVIAAGLSAPATISQFAAMGGAAVVRSQYTKDMDQYLAEQRLVRGAAQSAAGGNVTTSLLKQLGLGLENTVPGSAGYQTQEWGQYQNQRAGVQGLKGLGAGVAAGAAGATTLGAGLMIAGGTAAAEVTAGGALATGLGFMGPLGWAALGVGALGYGAYSYMQAAKTEKSQAQIHAENMMGFRQSDAEAFGIVGDKAGAMWMQEAGKLDLNQRMFGMEGTHQTVAAAARAGVGPERAMAAMSMMAMQGLNPGSQADFAGYTNNNYLFGYGPKTQQQFIRQLALNGGTLTGQQQQAGGLAMAAGLGGTDAYAARGAMTDYQSGLASQRGANQDLGTVGGGVAAAIGANAPGFNKMEGVGQGIANTQAAEKLMTGEGSALQQMQIAALREMGVTNAASIAIFVKQGLMNSSTQQSIANYLGGDWTREKVGARLAGTIKSYGSMVSTVLGKDEMQKMNKALGRKDAKTGEFHAGDVTTILTSGNKAGDNVTGGAATFEAANVAAFEQGKAPAGAVAPGATTGADVQSAGEAANAAAVEAAMKTILAGTGKTVTEALTSSISAGFTEMAKAVVNAGDKAKATQAPTTPAKSSVPGTGAPFLGPNKQSKFPYEA